MPKLRILGMPLGAGRLLKKNLTVLPRRTCFITENILTIFSKTGFFDDFAADIYCILGIVSWNQLVNVSGSTCG